MASMTKLTYSISEGKVYSDLNQQFDAVDVEELKKTFKSAGIEKATGEVLYAPKTYFRNRTTLRSLVPKKVMSDLLISSPFKDKYGDEGGLAVLSLFYCEPIIGGLSDFIEEDDNGFLRLTRSDVRLNSLSHDYELPGVEDQDWGFNAVLSIDPWHITKIVNDMKSKKLDLHPILLVDEGHANAQILTHLLNLSKSTYISGPTDPRVMKQRDGLDVFKDYNIYMKDEITLCQYVAAIDPVNFPAVVKTFLLSDSTALVRTPTSNATVALIMARINDISLLGTTVVCDPDDEAGVWLSALVKPSLDISHYVDPSKFDSMFYNILNYNDVD